jgi:hypothetical protein
LIVPVIMLVTKIILRSYWIHDIKQEHCKEMALQTKILRLKAAISEVALNHKAAITIQLRWKKRKTHYLEKSLVDSGSWGIFC